MDKSTRARENTQKAALIGPFGVIGEMIEKFLTDQI